MIQNLTKLSSISYLNSNVTDEPACDVNDLIKIIRFNLIDREDIEIFGKLLQKIKLKYFMKL